MLKQTTIKQIAEALEVSIATVSRALQDDPRIGLRTRMRVREMAQQLKYVPNQLAKHLRQHRSFTIGVLLPQFGEEFFSLAMAGIEDAMEGKGYQVFFTQSRDKKEREVAATRSFLNGRVDGVIASLSAETVDCQHFLELRNFGIPTVFFDRTPIDFPAHKVRCNVKAGAEALVRHLLEKGFRRIALLNGPAGLEISQERRHGFHAAMAAAGLEILPGFEKFTDLGKADVGEKMQALFASPESPEAIFAFSDYVAFHAMRWCRENGRTPGRDVVFASFANLPISNFMETPPVVSVEQFAYKMGSRAAEILLGILDNPDGERGDFQDVMMETELVVRT